MPAKKKPVVTSKALLKRIATEQLSSAESGSLIEQAQIAAEIELAEANKLSSSSKSRVAEGQKQKAAAGMEKEEETPEKTNHRSASDRDLIGSSR